LTKVPFIVAVVILGFFIEGKAQPAVDKPKEVALGYLKALAGAGDDAAREFLLGDVTLTAGDFKIPNFKIQSREKAKIEIKSLKEALQAMRRVDAVGETALNNIMTAAEIGDELTMATVTQEQANIMMEPAKRETETFLKAFPIFAICARADRDVYWNPSNPWREVTNALGESGKYKLEFHQFNILERKADKARIWPLRVLRIRTKDYDSGWKILPASDWDPDY